MTEFHGSHQRAGCGESRTSGSGGGRREKDQPDKLAPRLAAHLTVGSMTRHRHAQEVETGPGEQALHRIGDPSDVRLSVHIANNLIQDINTGKFTPGKPLPSKDELSERYGGSAGPPQRAFRELAELGLIYRVPGLGYYLVGGRKRDAHTEHREKAHVQQSSDERRERSAGQQANRMMEHI